MWLVHFLPLAIIAAIGNLVGVFAYWLIPERRMVTRTNLRLCFPALDENGREKLARRHMRAFCRSFIERGILWWGSKERIRDMVRIEGLEHLQAVQGKPVIVFAPHFVGLDATLSRLTIDHKVAVMYSRQKDPLFDLHLYRGRSRFGANVFPRQGAIRKTLRAIKAGELYYYLPDLDHGPDGTVFVPFFGVPAATVTGLAYIARSTGAVVLPCVTRMLPGGGGYVARLYPAWADFPSPGKTAAEDVADARRMLAFIEERVLEMPEQYFWLHKRFKTRPPGEPRFY
jgi:KDO2-lipid IV(A) lauroyltransferase